MEYKINTAFIVFMSPAGTTHHVARVIANTLEMSKIEALLFDLGSNSDDKAFLSAIQKAKHNSCLFIGSPVYVLHALPAVIKFISKLPKDIDQPAIPFVSWGGACSGIALSELAKALTEQGKRVVGAAKILALHSLMWQSDKPFGRNHPGAEDDEMIKTMVTNIMTKLSLSSKTKSQIQLAELDYYPEKIRAQMQKVTLSKFQPNMPQRDIIESACTLCEVCADNCPVDAITFSPYPKFGDQCISCYNCVKKCPESALKADMSEIEKHIRVRAEEFNERPYSQFFL